MQATTIVPSANGLNHGGGGTTTRSEKVFSTDAGTMGISTGIMEVRNTPWRWSPRNRRGLRGQAEEKENDLTGKVGECDTPMGDTGKLMCVKLETS